MGDHSLPGLGLDRWAVVFPVRVRVINHLSCRIPIRLDHGGGWFNIALRRKRAKEKKRRKKRTKERHRKRSIFTGGPDPLTRPPLPWVRLHLPSLSQRRKC